MVAHSPNEIMHVSVNKIGDAARIAAYGRPVVWLGFWQTCVIDDHAPSFVALAVSNYEVSRSDKRTCLPFVVANDGSIHTDSRSAKPLLEGSKDGQTIPTYMVYGLEVRDLRWHHVGQHCFHAACVIPNLAHVSAAECSQGRHSLVVGAIIEKLFHHA